jgi:hypothetical protein
VTIDVGLTRVCEQGPIRVRSPLALAHLVTAAWDRTWLHGDKRRGHQLNLRRGNACMPSSDAGARVPRPATPSVSVARPIHVEHVHGKQPG